MGRLARAVAVTSVGLLVVAGCTRATVLDVATNTQVATDRPPVTAAQARGIAERVLGEASVADALRTTDAIETAFTGVALRTAASRYAVEKSTAPEQGGSGEALQPPPPPTEVIRTVGARYPRSILTVSPAVEENTRELAVLVSGSVLDPYRVASRVRLLPGAAMPDMVSSGAPVLSSTTSAPGGLAAVPAAALKDYATLLQTGKSPGTSFAPDPVVASVRNNAKQQASQVSKIASFSQKHSVSSDPVHVVGTRAGGALVVGALTRVDTFTVKKGKGHLAPPAAYKALAGGVTKITKEATVKTVEIVALVIPPSGGGPVRVIGFTELPESVKAK